MYELKHNLNNGGGEVVELVKKAQRGDRDAFIKLIDEKKGQMYKTALIQLSNNSDALDAVQDTILVAFERIYTLRQPEHFYSWLMRILINQCHDIQRERKKIIPIEEIYSSGEAGYRCADYDKIEIREMLQALDEIYRTVLDLRYNHDMKVEDIARTLGIPSGTVKSRINKGLKLLREECGEIGKEGITI